MQFFGQNDVTIQRHCKSTREILRKIKFSWINFRLPRHVWVLLWKKLRITHDFLSKFIFSFAKMSTFAKRLHLDEKNNSSGRKFIHSNFNQLSKESFSWKFSSFSLNFQSQSKISKCIFWVKLHWKCVRWFEKGMITNVIFFQIIRFSQVFLCACKYSALYTLYVCCSLFYSVSVKHTVCVLIGVSLMVW